VITFGNYFNSHKNLDYLQENISCDDFDWNEFFTRYNENYIYESITYPVVIKDEVHKNNSKHLELEFDINDSKFLSIVDTNTCESELDPLKMDIASHQMKHVNTKPLEHLSELYKANPNKLVVKYQFRDSIGDTSITNKIGNSAFAVLKVAAKAFLFSVDKIGLDNIFCIEFHVKKTESKRLDLYQNLIKRTPLVRDTFTESYTDHTSDTQYITYYIWRKN
jgi:hypothetical protein